MEAAVTESSQDLYGIGIGCTYMAQRYIRFLCASHQFCLIIEPVCSSTNSTPWGAYSPAAITTLLTIQTHKQSRSNQVPIYSCVERVYIQMKCLAQGHSAKLRQPRPVPKTLQCKVAGHSHRAMMPCIYMEYIFYMYRETEGGHCQGTCPQWFFYIPLNVGETAPLFTWSCQPREIYSLQC